MCIIELKLDSVFYEIEGKYLIGNAMFKLLCQYLLLCSSGVKFQFVNENLALFAVEVLDPVGWWGVVHRKLVVHEIMSDSQDEMKYDMHFCRFYILFA